MATVPTEPEAVALADIGTYLQAKKDKGQTIVGRPYVVAETGQPFAVALVGSTYYALGVERLLPEQGGTAGPYSATTANAAVFPLPLDKSVLLTSLDVVINSSSLTGSAYWTVAVKGVDSAGSADAGVTTDNKLDTNSTDTAHTITTFTTNPMPAGALRVALTATKTSTPGNLTMYAALRGRDVLATLT
jgi:hypothetical protein